MKSLNFLFVIGSLVIVFGVSGFLTRHDNSDVREIKYEWYQTTVVESVVPAGLGRSRLITTNETGELEEVKLENFFSVSGINFANIRHNDQVVTSHITDLANEGWELYETTEGVYSGKSSSGIFITRYLFRRPVE